MDARRCQKIAQRMNTLLQQELGQGLDVRRMLDEPRYSRDVLLVCDALRGGELEQLSAQYRLAGAGESERPVRAGFRASRFLNSLFGSLPEPQRDSSLRRGIGAK